MTTLDFSSFCAKYSPFNIKFLVFLRNTIMYIPSKIQIVTNLIYPTFLTVIPSLSNVASISVELNKVNLKYPLGNIRYLSKIWMNSLFMNFEPNSQSELQVGLTSLCKSLLYHNRGKKGRHFLVRYSFLKTPPKLGWTLMYSF